MTIKFLNDPARLWNLVKLMLGGVEVTLAIFSLTLLLAIPLGMLVAQGRMARLAPLRGVTSLYIYIMHPLVMILFGFALTALNMQETAIIKWINPVAVFAVTLATGYLFYAKLCPFAKRIANRERKSHV